jgi:predicted HTH transcriptional regulator
MEHRRLDRRELRELLSQGESGDLEFKKRISDARVAAREIAALANSGGGRLIVGVEEGRGLLGLDDPERTRRLVEHAAQLIDPRPPVDTYIEEIDGSELVVADIRGPKPPYIGPDGAIVHRSKEGRRLAFSGRELQAALTNKAVSAARPPEDEIAEALDRMNAQLEETNSRLENTQQQLAEEGQLAARERSEAQKARGWRVVLVGWILSGLVGAAIGAALTWLL